MKIAHRGAGQDQPAPCRNARRLLLVAAAVTSLLILAVSAHLLRPGLDGHDAPERWMKALSLSTPAMWTAGSPMRHPETVHPGIDLRYTPGVETLP